MDMYTNTKKSKKFILTLVILILFSFCYPKNTKAWFEGEDIVAAPAKIFWLIEEGVIVFLNNIFTNPENAAKVEADYDGDYVMTSLEVKLTPETIIKGKFILFDANIFKEITNAAGYYDYVEGGTVSKGKIDLRETISGWYYALRNFSIVALLSVLVYVGIRMIMSTIAQDKAKYKVMFKDWLIAICLVVVMHYMMIGILNITSMITDALGGGANSNMIGDLAKDITGILSDEGDSNNYKYNGMDLTDAYAKIIVLAGIIAYTFIFAVKYLKREFTVIFLVLLGPISCITYPIDKISDGKAQAFNKWFSEFLYQVIIQPFHLLLYIVLIGTAADLADANVIYALVCFAVMIPAEKFIKEMFGFKDKLGSPLGAMATGAAAGQIFNKMKGGSSSGKTGKETDNSSSELPVKTKSAPLPGSEGNNANYISEEDKARVPSSDQNNGGDVSIDTNDTSELNEPAEGGIDTSDNPELDEQEEGGIDTSDNPELDEQEEGSRDTSGENTENPKKRNGFRKGIDAVRDSYNREVMRKYGTLNKKELKHKRAWRAAKGVGKLGGRTIKKAVTLAGALAGATALGLAGAMVGQGSKGAAAGAALGAGLGNSLGKQGDKIAAKGGYYAGKFYNAASGKDTNKEKYKSNQNNIDRARRNFKERNGYLGSADDIDKELDNMYKMQEYGVKDTFLDDAMDLYSSNTKTMNDTDALNSAIISANMAQDFSAEKFRDPKAMQGLYDDYFKRYKAAGIGDENADKMVRNLISAGGALKGVHNVALPPVKEKVTIPTRDNMYGKLKFGNDATSESQQQQVKAIQNILVEIGLDDNDIKQVMEYSIGDNNEEIITSFAENVQYIISNDIKQNASIPIGEIRSGTMKSHIVKTEKEQVIMKENIEKLDLRKQTGITDEKVLSKMRELEEKNGTTQFRAEGGKMIRGELSKNDKNNLSEKALHMAEGYKRAATVMNPNTSKKKQSRNKK